MDATDLAFAGIAKQAELIAAGEVGSRELVDLYLERIERLDPKLNAFRVVFDERARMEADQADARRGAGNERPLLGVPIAVKDEIDVAGEVTALGTNARDEPAREDSEVVRRLRAAGAVIIGKTNVPELCIWPFTETATFGVTRNPWDRQRAPGGSSGGSGAAVAAGLVGAALSGDGAGSTRIPAAWCRLFGLKPQRDRVPLAPLLEGWHGLTVYSMLTHSVADTALFLDVVADPAPIGGEGSRVEADTFLQAARTPPVKLRIAYSTRIPPGVVTSLDPDARRAFDEMVELLRSLGHEVNEHDPDYGLDAVPAVVARMLAGIRDQVRLVDHPERLERRTRALGRVGAMLPEQALTWSREHEPVVRERLGRVFERHDVLITPATAQPPPQIGRFQGRGGVWTLNAVAGLVPYNAAWNLTGQPACSVPAGFDAEGLPRAVQLVGRPSDEVTLIALAAQIEAERPWAQERPPGFE